MQYIFILFAKFASLTVDWGLHSSNKLTINTLIITSKVNLSWMSIEAFSIFHYEAHCITYLSKEKRLLLCSWSLFSINLPLTGWWCIGGRFCSQCSIVVPVADSRWSQWSESHVHTLIHGPQVVGACCSDAQTEPQVSPGREQLLVSHGRCPAVWIRLFAFMCQRRLEKDWASLLLDVETDWGWIEWQWCNEMYICVFIYFYYTKNYNSTTWNVHIAYIHI